MELDPILTQHGLTPAQYAVLFHVHDTVVTDRASLASWTSRHLPNNVPQELDEDACLQAIESLIGCSLLVELSTEDIDSDLAFWRGERRPIGWGVHRDRHAGDVDLTQRGFELMHRVNPWPSRPARSYCNEAAVIRVLGETEEACRQEAAAILLRLDGYPWHWTSEPASVEPIRSIGQWWYARYVLIPTGFEICIRR